MKYADSFIKEHANYTGSGLLTGIGLGLAGGAMLFPPLTLPLVAVGALGGFLFGNNEFDQEMTRRKKLDAEPRPTTFAESVDGFAGQRDTFKFFASLVGAAIGIGVACLIGGPVLPLMILTLGAGAGLIGLNAGERLHSHQLEEHISQEVSIIEANQAQARARLRAQDITPMNVEPPGVYPDYLQTKPQFRLASKPPKSTDVAINDVREQAVSKEVANVQIA